MPYGLVRGTTSGSTINHGNSRTPALGARGPGLGHPETPVVTRNTKARAISRDHVFPHIAHVNETSCKCGIMECSHDAHDNAWRYGAFFRGVFHLRDLGCRLRRPNRKERDRVHWGPGVVNFGVLSLYQYTSRL